MYVHGCELSFNTTCQFFPSSKERLYAELARRFAVEYRPAPDEVESQGGEMAQWIRFEHAGTIGFGTLTRDTIVVHEGNMFDAPTPTGVVRPVDHVTPVAPTAAGKMLALWNNSRAVAAKLNQAIPPEPLYFIKANGSYLGTGGTIRKPPSYDGKVVFEGELGIVIGRVCRAVSEAESEECIFDYTCVNGFLSEIGAVLVGFHG